MNFKYQRGLVHIIILIIPIAVIITIILFLSLKNSSKTYTFENELRMGPTPTFQPSNTPKPIFNNPFGSEKIN